MAKRAKIVRHMSSVSRRQPLLEEGNEKSASLAEMAGGTTAGFAAIACCAPYGVANLLVLAVYKVPAGLCRKAIRQHRRRQLMKSGMLPVRSLSVDAELAEFYSASAVFPWSEDEVEVAIISEEEFQVLEKEMWDHFSSTGFWRSPSRREA